MRIEVLICFLLAILLGSGPSVKAQNSESEAARSYFSGYFAADHNLLSGNIYQPLLYNDQTGHPYCLGSAWHEGVVVMDGKTYSGLKLRYDILNHQLVLNTSTILGKFLQLELKKERIERFKLGERTFVPDPKPDPIRGITFIEELTPQPVSLQIKRQKRTRVSPGGNTDFVYQEDVLRYIRMGEELHRYRGKQTLFRLFPKLKPQLKTFIKTNKLRLRKKMDYEHAMLVNYCIQLLEGKE